MKFAREKIKAKPMTIDFMFYEWVLNKTNYKYWNDYDEITDDYIEL
jgi:hypothetical protein